MIKDIEPDKVARNLHYTEKMLRLHGKKKKDLNVIPEITTGTIFDQFTDGINELSYKIKKSKVL